MHWSALAGMPAAYAIGSKGIPARLQQAGRGQLNLYVKGTVHPASINSIFQQTPQLLPMGLPALAVGYYHICTTSQVTEVEVVEAGPALHGPNRSCC